ncbi:CPBP family intramembrane metalloprotease [Microbacterium sp. zg-Y818]|uniref:CPBP family intramembrane glutamic endopeptidase n=1 Tax=unclassified Microbacterium TaxID=2609290 RepID=UPI00214AD891|nr:MULTISPECIES: CPBP family intramembrane glutamic endopeptidase [unclassified Microbacterium]MCR2801906.1 CPBP family intramembrane metalloprotease [Microbacterium sp. zg.Y818]WIM22837.1 CPBP family intramembrane metalloprotease [Microbacterium sp. zg-Y818]
MPDQPTDVAVAPLTPQQAEPPRTRTERRRRTDWRLGGRTVRPWRGMLAGWAVLSLGAGVLIGTGFVVLWPDQAWVGPASTAALWVAMLVPVVVAFRRSRPVGLLRLRPLDLLYGLMLGLLLRLLQGWAAAAFGTGASFPVFLTIDGRLPTAWWLTEALPGVMVAPVVEEFFFRAVLLIAVYAALRRAYGGVAAGIAAVLVSTALFVIVHSVGGALTLDAALSLSAVGLTCALLVLLTGRIWGAVLVHVVYNASFIALGLLGTLA